MLYNKKIASALLTNSGGFTILKAQRHLIPGKYATIGGSMVHILICDDDAVFAQDMAKKILALPAYSPKSMNVQCLTNVSARKDDDQRVFQFLFDADFYFVITPEVIPTMYYLDQNNTIRSEVIT